jgi:hypothetical protein
MANLLQSSQTQATSAPQYFTDYLSNLASAGKAATDPITGAQYVGAQPLQQQAFQMAGQNVGQFQAPITQAEQLATQAGGINVTGAAQPFLVAGTQNSPLNAMQPYANNATGYTGAQAGNPLIGSGASMSGLSAANPYLAGASASGGLNAAVPYLNQATQSPAELAQQYMNPFINTAVKSMSDIGQRNIQNNLAPAATAAAVGSGQFGSQRGAQVQGQITAQANQDLNSQIQQLLASGYGQALTAGGQQNALLGQLGNTAGTLGQQQANLLGQLGSTAGNLTNTQAQNLITGGTNLGQLQQGANTISSNLAGTAATAQQAQNQANLTAAQAAASAAEKQGQLQNTSAQNLGALGQAGQKISLEDINALSMMGGQQQTIGQNKELFPLQNLSTVSNLLKGYSMPTTTKTTAEQSPLSVLAGVGTGAAALFQPMRDSAGNILKDANGNPINNFSSISSGIKDAYNLFTGGNKIPDMNNGSTIDASGNYVTPSGPGGTVVNKDYPDYGNSAVDTATGGLDYNAPY